MKADFVLDGLEFRVDGIMRGDFIDLHSIHVQGNAANIRKLLSGPALERIEEAAAEALVEAGDAAPFDVPLLPAEPPVDMERSPTLAEVNARRGYGEGGAR